MGWLNRNCIKIYKQEGWFWRWDHFRGWLSFKYVLLTYEAHLQNNGAKVVKQNANMCSCDHTERCEQALTTKKN